MLVLKISSLFALLSLTSVESVALFEKVNYDEFIGVWHSCLETTTMTYEGEVKVKKHTKQNVPCRGIQVANITYVGDDNGMDHTGQEKVTQILQLRQEVLNHCELLGITPDMCPNATIAGNTFEGKNVKYVQNYHGIGSYGSQHHVKFYGEEKSYYDVHGELIRVPDVDAVEDQDFFDCTYKAELQGIVCDARQNEYRWGIEGSDVWHPIGFADFGTYYLVENMAACPFCENYQCSETKFRIRANILGLGSNNKITCSNVNKIENEHVKKLVCETAGTEKNTNKKGLIKELCPNACGECLD